MKRDYLSTNRDIWNADAGNWVDFAKARWNLETPEWGAWGNSDDGLNLLPADTTDMDAIELGCGTGYVSAWMARRGARVTAMDPSVAQLATARQLASEHDADIAPIAGCGERIGQRWNSNPPVSAST